MEAPAVMVTLRAESTSGTMHLHVEMQFSAGNVDDALRKIRQAVGDAAPIFVDPEFRGTNTLRRDT